MARSKSTAGLASPADLSETGEAASGSPATPRVSIDLGKIEHNARAIVELFAAHGIEVCGVTKATCGHAAVASAMLRGGVSMLADSRLENIHRLRAAMPETPPDRVTVTTSPHLD